MNKVMLEKISGDGRVETMCSTISIFLMAFVIFYMSYSNRFDNRIIMAKTKDAVFTMALGLKNGISALLTGGTDRQEK